MSDFNHPQRLALAQELHARPFPILDSPSDCVTLAVMAGENDGELLNDLISHFGLPKPIDDRHYYEENSEICLKWEKHTEFFVVVLVKSAFGDQFFKNPVEELFSQPWLDKIEGRVISAIKLRLKQPVSAKEAERSMLELIEPLEQDESLSVSYVLSKSAIIASDFKLDDNEFVRFVVVPIGQVGRQRLGRIVQRLIEIEVYRAMSMLTLPMARNVFSRVTELERDLAKTVDEVAKASKPLETGLDQIMSISSEVEFLSAENNYRFGAAEAYSALVNHRIEVLREERYLGWQTFSEFMMRRFSPTIRTCSAASRRLKTVAKQASRATDLLGTKVNLKTNQQNSELLSQMDNRAALQLRLQQTVEGLSVVAIGYYAVNLLSYLLSPVIGDALGGKSVVPSLLVIPVLLFVFLGVRRIRKQFGH